MNLVTPKAGAKQELLFNELASDLLVESITKGVLEGTLKVLRL
jgi:hypothetical protein